MTDSTTPEPTHAPVAATVPDAAPATVPDAAPVAAPVAAPKRSLRWLTPTLALVAALAVGVVGGVFIGKSGSAQPAGFARGQFANGQLSGGQGGGQAGAGQFGGFTSGTIVSIDGDTLTIRSQDGSTKTVSADSSTTVTKTTKSSVDALKKGQKITVIGTSDGDDSVKATAISEGAAGLRGVLGRPGGGTGRTGANDN
ncbi:MAG TPA: hypothetical protein VN619_01125 [Lacisediminihabitans sp.]|nr:hypothetical protein [Lacisediminihabitans sp.]HXD60506.1 hypothetical protein [Lacisediminihabitans sp.]